MDLVLKVSGLAPNAVVAACMHKLGLMVYGILKPGTPFDPHFLTFKAASNPLIGRTHSGIAPRSAWAYGVLRDAMPLLPAPRER